MAGMIHLVSPDVLEPDQKHLEAIRRFFLHPEDTYSIEELANLWRLPPDDVRDLYHDHLLRREEGGGAPRISWDAAVATGMDFSILRPLDVERALGAEFSRARPEAWRTVPILVHLPRFIADAIAADHSIPPGLPIDVRLEQIILEVFASGEYPVPARTDRDDPPQTVG